MPELRYYQEEAAAMTVARLAEPGIRGCLLDMATGSGKTNVTLEIGRRRHRDTGRRVLFVADQQELVQQAARRAHEFTGLQCEIEMGERRADQAWFRAPVVVASKDSLHPRRLRRFDPHDFGTVIFDEADKATRKNKSWWHVFEHFYQNPELRTVGCTATARRHDRQGLCFDAVSYSYQLRKAVEEGWLLCPDQQYLHVKDLNFDEVVRLNNGKGDFDPKALEEAINEERTGHYIVRPTLEIVGQALTLTVSPTVAHAKMTAILFNRYRPGCARSIDGQTDDAERSRYIEQFTQREFNILCVCGVLNRGWDCPALEYVVMNRPTKSLTLYLQCAVGRGTRPLVDFLALGITGRDQAEDRKLAILASAKPRFTILDPVGNSGRHKCRPVCLADALAGSLPPEVVEAVARQPRERPGGGPADVLVELDRARVEWERAEEERRKIIRAQAEYTTTGVNIFGDGPAPLPQAQPQKLPGTPATPKQKAFLQKRDRWRDGMTKAQAGREMGRLKEEWAGKALSPKLTALLERAGERTNIPRDRAGAIADVLQARKWAPRDYSFSRDRLSIQPTGGGYVPVVLDTLRGKVRLGRAFRSERDCREYLAAVCEDGNT